MLYGGSVKHMSARSPASTFSTCPRTVASPHSNRCCPMTHRSPATVTTFSCSSGTASSSVSPVLVCSGPARISSISSSVKPTRSKSNSSSFNDSNSTRSISSSHPALRARRLSARTSARRWVSVRWSRTMTGTSVIFNLRAAARRAWPAMIIPSAPTRIGLVQPNSAMLAATWATCSSVCVRALRAYGISLSIGQNWTRRLRRRSTGLRCSSTLAFTPQPPSCLGRSLRLGLVDHVRNRRGGGGERLDDLLQRRQDRRDGGVHLLGDRRRDSLRVHADASRAHVRGAIGGHGASRQVRTRAARDGVQLVGPEGIGGNVGVFDGLLRHHVARLHGVLARLESDFLDLIELILLTARDQQIEILVSVIRALGVGCGEFGMRFEKLIRSGFEFTLALVGRGDFRHTFSPSKDDLRTLPNHGSLRCYGSLGRLDAAAFIGLGSLALPGAVVWVWPVVPYRPRVLGLRVDGLLDRDASRRRNRLERAGAPVPVHQQRRLAGQIPDAPEDHIAVGWRQFAATPGAREKRRRRDGGAGPHKRIEDHVALVTEREEEELDQRAGERSGVRSVYGVRHHHRGGGASRAHRVWLRTVASLLRCDPPAHLEFDRRDAVAGGRGREHRHVPVGCGGARHPGRAGRQREGPGLAGDKAPRAKPTLRPQEAQGFLSQ